MTEKNKDVGLTNFITEKELLEEIKKLVKSTPNDTVLGNLVRAKILDHQESTKK
jgi:hypothetical protein